MKTTKLASCGTFIFALVLGMVLLGRPAGAQTVPPKLVPFNDFLQQVSRVAPTSYLAQSTSRVKTPAAFEEMRQHILTMYGGVSVRHSFLLGSDPYDCVPIMQQPSVRLRGLKSIATAPPSPPVPSGTRLSNPPATQTGQLRPGQTLDALGNSVICEEGTIPMRRITLEELSRFETLQQFFQKGPNGAGFQPHGQVGPPVAGPPHRYAISQQNVANIGGSSVLNLWNPRVNTTADGPQAMSLSQQWYVAFLSSGAPQTAEAGWNVNPILYGGSTDTHLFIYWTADGYNTTGCYNLTCVAFVQVVRGNYFGGVFSQVSTDGGPQYEFTLEYFLYQGNWWLNINGTWVGYYPGALYNGGPLATAASVIQYGGETFGPTIWPPMGSGEFAGSWWTRAAYQRNIFYLASPTQAFWAILFSYAPSPSCYTDIIGNNSGVTLWNTYLFFGGPGSTAC
jgi:hypothetical protein